MPFKFKKKILSFHEQTYKSQVVSRNEFLKLTSKIKWKADEKCQYLIEKAKISLWQLYNQ